MSSICLDKLTAQSAIRGQIRKFATSCFIRDVGKAIKQLRPKLLDVVSYDPQEEVQGRSDRLLLISCGYCFPIS